MHRKLFWICIFTIVAAVGLTYGRAINFSFLTYDDGVHIYDDQLMHPVTPHSILQFWNVPFRHHWEPGDIKKMPPYEQLYAPLTFTIWAGLTHIGVLPAPVATPTGTTTTFNPLPFHLVNIVAHTLGTLAFFCLLCALLRSRRGQTHQNWQLFAAFIGALLFGLHPYQVESVAWITQLNTLLSTLFGLLSLLAYLRWAQMQKPDSKFSAPGWYALASLLFFLDLLSKPTILMLPLIAFLLAGVAHSTPWRRQIYALWPWLVLSAIYAAFIKSVQPIPGPESVVHWWLRPFLVGDSISFYLWHLVWPWGLCPDYNLPPHALLAYPVTYVLWLIPVVLGWAAFKWRKKLPFIYVAGCIFLLCELPTSGITATYFHFRSVVADRYMYLPLLGVGLAVAAFLTLIRPQSLPARRSLQGVSVAVVLILGVLSWRQTGFWRSDPILYSFSGGMQANPHSWWGWNNLGSVSVQENNYPKAIYDYQNALRIAQDKADIFFNLAIAQKMVGQLDAALANAKHSLVLDPRSPPTLDVCGTILAAQNHLAEAIPYWKKALVLDPTFASSHANLGVALAMQGHTKEAIAQWQKAVAYDPENGEMRYNLGVALKKQGKFAQAAQQWTKALALKPGDPGLIAALKSLPPGTGLTP